MILKHGRQKFGTDVLFKDNDSATSYSLHAGFLIHDMLHDEASLVGVEMHYSMGETKSHYESYDNMSI